MERRGQACSGEICPQFLLSEAAIQPTLATLDLLKVGTTEASGSEKERAFPPRHKQTNRSMCEWSCTGTDLGRYSERAYSQIAGQFGKKFDPQPRHRRSTQIRGRDRDISSGTSSRFGTPDLQSSSQASWRESFQDRNSVAMVNVKELPAVPRHAKPPDFSLDLSCNSVTAKLPRC